MPDKDQSLNLSDICDYCPDVSEVDELENGDVSTAHSYNTLLSSPSSLIYEKDQPGAERRKCKRIVFGKLELLILEKWYKYHKSNGEISPNSHYLTGYTATLNSISKCNEPNKVEAKNVYNWLKRGGTQEKGKNR